MFVQASFVHNSLIGSKNLISEERSAANARLNISLRDMIDPYISGDWLQSVVGIGRPRQSRGPMAKLPVVGTLPITSSECKRSTVLRLFISRAAKEAKS